MRLKQERSDRRGLPAGALPVVCPACGGATIEAGRVRGRRGFTLIELVVVMLLLAVVATISIPRALKSTPRSQVNLAARALTRDLELLRMRAIAAKRSVQVRFDASQGFYTAFIDESPDRSGEMRETASEVQGTGLITRGSVDGVPGVRLPRGVVFGVGAASGGPDGASASEAIELEGGRVRFDERGSISPYGAGGVVYLTHVEDGEAVAAVTISGASAFRAYFLRGGRWER